MALAVPTAYLVSAKTKASTKGGGDGDSERLFRLPEHHVADLRAIATGVEESDAGVCCRYLIDQLTSGGSPDVDEDGYEHHLEAAERFCERFGVWRHPLVTSWRNRLRRARLTIRRMHERGASEHVSVLMIAHGHPDPMVRDIPELVAMKELGSLARYTDIVEERRLELAHAEATRMVANPGFVQTFDVFGDGSTWERAIAEHAGWNADEFAELIDLAAMREARATAVSRVTSADALRSALLPFNEPPAVQERGEAHHAFQARCEARTERKKRHRQRVDAFVTELRLQTRRMLAAAEATYHATWLASPLPVERGERGNFLPDVTRPVEHAPVPEARVRGAGWSST